MAQLTTLYILIGICIGNSIAIPTEKLELNNVTLDTYPPPLPRYWEISPTTVSKWFEYYDTTDSLKAAASDTSRCPSKIANFADNLDAVDGIWVACQDPALPENCHTITPTFPCHPHFIYDTNSPQPSPFHRIKIHMWASGFGTLRVWLFIGIVKCYDYSHHKDPNSDCDHIPIGYDPEDGWAEIEVVLDQEPGRFYDFTIQPIARFADDVVLIDRVEATQDEEKSNCIELQ